MRAERAATFPDILGFPLAGILPAH